MINFKVDKELIQFFENNMNKAKEHRDSIEDKTSEIYIHSQGALDEARRIYFELFTKHMEENFVKLKQYLVN